MNMQAMMKQVQQLQKEMTSEKSKIDNEIYSVVKSFLEVEMKGNKELVKVKINQEKIEADEIEILEDLILVAINDLNKKIDQDTEKRLGKFTKGMPGLF